MQVGTSLIYCLTRKKSSETTWLSFGTEIKRILDRILIGLAKTLIILGVTLAVVVLIISVFTTIITATGDFLVSMLSVYVLGGLAAIAITLIINIGSGVRPAIVAESKTRTYLAYVFLGVGIAMLATVFPSLSYGIVSHGDSQTDSQFLIIYTIVLSVSLLAAGLFITGIYLLHSRPRA